MRAQEFIVEDSIVHSGVKPHKDQEKVMPSAHRVAGTADRTYDLNRIMQIVAGADGKTMPLIPKQSWAGKNNTAHPYTKEESNMLKHAYKAYGADWDDALAPNDEEKSLEPDDVHNISPVKGFAGYPR